MGVQCLLPDCDHCSDYDKCKYYRIPKDLFEYYKWKHFLESVVNINEQLCSLLKLSQIMLLSFLCQSCTHFSLVLWSEFCVQSDGNTEVNLTLRISALPSRSLSKNQTVRNK